MALVALLGCLAGAAGCRDITTLKQENPGRLIGSTVYVPKNAQLLVNGAIGDFECAFSRYVVGTGLLSDELTNAISNTQNINYDRRTILSTEAYGTNSCASGVQFPAIYSTLSTARASADTALAKLEGWTDAEVPNRMKLIGQAAAYAGYSLVLLGESMCGAAINVGPLLTPTQLFTEAQARFDKAIAAATAANDQTTLNFALLGRARALLDLGNTAAAGTDAAKIPAGFVVNMSTDAVNARRQNVAYVHTAQSFNSSVDPSFRNLTINGAPDPRVAVTNTGKTGTAGTPIWTPDKYPTIATVIPIARYAEAQLIVAEAKAAANDLTGARDAINVVRAASGVPAYDVTGKTAADVKADIIEERRRELFLEGHRLGDIRRNNLPLVPPKDTPYQSGGTYGDQRCFPLPDVERINNPNIGNG